MNKMVGSVENNSGHEKRYCSNCGEELSEVIWGLALDSYLENLRKQDKKYCLGGCLCFGDERDAKYKCEKCGSIYKRDLTPLELMKCPLEASGSIIKGDCVNGELKEQRACYSLLKNRDVVCKMICPNIGKSVAINTKDGRTIKGQILRTFKTTVDCRGEHVTLVRKQGFETEYEDILLEDICSVKSDFEGCNSIQWRQQHKDV